MQSANTLKRSPLMVSDLTFYVNVVIFPLIKHNFGRNSYRSPQLRTTLVARSKHKTLMISTIRAIAYTRAFDMCRLYSSKQNITTICAWHRYTAVKAIFHALHCDYDSFNPPNNSAVQDFVANSMLPSQLECGDGVYDGKWNGICA